MCDVVEPERWSESGHLLRLVTVSEKRWRARSRVSGGDGWNDEGEEGFESGDCDDEDECTGVSGLGPPPRRKRLRIFADVRLPQVAASLRPPDLPAVNPLETSDAFSQSQTKNK
ncbi:Glypican-3 [Dissostichus eleginoides]|nr:Glypican-3 [Dissostichus eleginoides]